jgi:hypothetical protein
LVVGSIRLPHETIQSSFGRFRQKLEDTGLPQRGVTAKANFCAAGNMSITRRDFHEIGGFDRAIVSGEDQDLAMRHVARGRRIAFEPAAQAIHCDSALDLRAYCQRVEWGSRNLMPFVNRYPTLPDNVDRQRVNGRVRIGREPLPLSAKKVLKSILSLSAVREVLFGVASVLEGVSAPPALLDRTYRTLIGIHMLRGYREGLQTYRSVVDGSDTLVGD